jgi:hypothetical protein
MPSLYIDGEGCGAIIILVESKELLSIGIRLVWPILLVFGVANAAPLLAPVRGPGQGPRLIVISLENPMDPISIRPRAFYG